MPMNLGDAVEKVKGIADDARALVDELKSVLGDDPDTETTAGQRSRLTALIRRAAEAERDLKAAARTQRTNQKDDLRERVRMIRSAINTPGLSPSARSDLQDLLDTNEAELLRLQGQDATDFSDLLSDDEWGEIERLLEKAKREVQQKKRAAEALAVAVKTADVALTVAGKLAKAAIP